MRRNRRGRVRSVAFRPRARPARAHAVQPDQDARRLRRGGAGTGLARPRAQAFAVDPRDAEKRRIDDARPARRRLHGRTGPDRRAARGRIVRALAGVGARGSGYRRASHGRPSARAASRSRSSGTAVRGAAGIRRTFDVDRSGGHRRLSTARRHARRCGRRSLRQNREIDGTSIPRRTGVGEARGVRPRRALQILASDDGSSGTRFQFQRIEDAGAARLSGERRRKRCESRHRTRIRNGHRRHVVDQMPPCARADRQHEARDRRRSRRESHIARKTCRRSKARTDSAFIFRAWNSAPTTAR